MLVNVGDVSSVSSGGGGSGGSSGGGSGGGTGGSGGADDAHGGGDSGSGSGGGSGSGSGSSPGSGTTSPDLSGGSSGSDLDTVNENLKDIMDNQQDLADIEALELGGINQLVSDSATGLENQIITNEKLQNIAENQNITANNTNSIVHNTGVISDQLVGMEGNIITLRDFNVHGFSAVVSKLNDIESALQNGEGGEGGEVSTEQDYTDAYNQGQSNLAAGDFTGDSDIPTDGLPSGSYSLIPGLDSVTGPDGTTGGNWLTGIFDDLLENNPVADFAENSGVTTSNPVCSMSDTFQMFGDTMTLELSMCDWENELQMLGNLMVAITTLTSFIMVFRKG